MKGGTGFGMIPRHVRGHLTAIEIAVYVALSWRAGADGSSWPSHATIAEEAGTSVNSVKRALDSLRAKGLATWEPRVDPNHGGPSSNRYWIAIQAPKGGRPERATPQAPVGYERDSLNESHSLLGQVQGSRNREADVFDADALVAELDDDYEATGFLSNTWADGAELLVEMTLAELREDPAINDESAWLAAALKHMTPVRKAARLLELVGADDE